MRGRGIETVESSSTSHPHPNPLPSRERGFFDFSRDHQYFIPKI
jgi:hypothetical protein